MAEVSELGLHGDSNSDQNDAMAVAAVAASGEPAAVHEHISTPDGNTEHSPVSGGLLSRDRQASSASGVESVPVSVDFVPLTSPGMSETLYRADEAAYTGACGRTHMLRVRKRKRQLDSSPMNPDCLAMAQHGSGMKSQRRNILAQLYTLEKRREIIVSELWVAMDKIESRACRAEAASAAWAEYCNAKGKQRSPLDWVLSSPSGRRAWEEHLQRTLAVMEAPKNSKQVDASPRRRASLQERNSSGISESLLLEGEVTHSPHREEREATHSRDWTESVDGTTSVSSRPVAAEIFRDQERDEDSPLSVLRKEDEAGTGGEKVSPLSVLVGEDGDEAAVTGSRKPRTNSQELSFPMATVGEQAIGEEDQEEAMASTDPPFNTGNLHLALESLIKPIGQDVRGKGGCLNAKRCAEFCNAWMGGDLPKFLDPSLLQPIWSAVDQLQGTSGRRVRGEELSAAKESVRLEVQRLFFAGFLDSNEGQAYIMNAVQDGTLGPGEAQGFVTHLTESAQYDEDAQGFRRLIAHGDNWMHSRLVHEGVEQRIRVEAAEPLLRAMLEEVDRRIFDYRGELAVIVQHAYHLAALRAQPFIRGALARLKVPGRRKDTLSHAFLCAAVEVQRVFRGVLGRKRAQQYRFPSLSASFVPLQARVRGFLVRQRVAHKWSELYNCQAVEIQRVYRGHRDRGAAHAVLKEEAWAQNVDLHGWASAVIQRHARVWLARQTVHLKRVEVGLTSRVSELAERLATAEDSRSVSTVLSEVDKDYRTYERRIREMQAEESTMAATFVEKVLERRDAEIAGVWSSFVGAAVGHATTLKRCSDARRAHPILARDPTDGVKVGPDRKLLRLMERHATPAGASALPSAYLRAALPAHIELRGDSVETVIKSDPMAAATKAYAAVRPKRRRANNAHLSSDVAEPFPSQRDGADSPRTDGRSSHCWTNGTCFDTSLSTPATAATALTSGNGAADATHAHSSSSGSNRCGRSAALGGGNQNSSHRSEGGDGSDGGGGGGSGGGGDGGSGAYYRTEEQRAANGRALAPEGREGVADSDTATTLSVLESISDCRSRPREISPRVVGSYGHSSVGRDDGTSVLGRRGDVGPTTTGAREHIRIEWERGWDCDRENRGLTGDGQSRFPGSSVRQDMPSGLDEVVERFCAAAFLRGHVPQGLMSADTPPEEAYQRYLELPPSLAKIRHEQLCREASRPVASALRSRGFLVVQQLLPISKLEHLFSQAGAAAGESSAAVSLARELRTRSVKSSSRGGTDGGTGHLFTPLSAFCRHAMEGRTPCFDPDGKSRKGEPAGDGMVGESRGGRRAGGGGGGGGRFTSSKDEGSKMVRKKGPLRICLTGVRLEGGEGEEGDGRWDPRRYTSRPDDWLRPPCSTIKQRWDDSAKAFVGVNNYSFDRLYRRHHPLLPPCDDQHSDGSQRDDDSPGEAEQDEEGAKSRAGGDDLSHHIPRARPNVRDRYSRRVAEIMREEYDAFFEGMTPTARELYQHVFDDAGSWGTVEDPIGTLLRRAAFYVVEHPSPATRAEIATARARDCRAKGFRGNENKLARPIALATKFPPGKFEQELKEAAMTYQHVAMGPEALRAFIEHLDAVGTSHPSSSSSALETPGKSESMPRGGDADKYICPVAGRFGSTLTDPRRTLLERRLEAAETLAGPFALRLEADGVISVKVLARVPVRAWDLPPCLVEQVERMIGLLTARTCATDHYQAHHGSRGNSKPGASGKPASATRGGGRVLARKRVGMSVGADSDAKCLRKRRGGRRVRRQQRQPLLAFDPRFQRSAVDPFGRPPRLERVQAGPGQHRGKGGDRHSDGGDRMLLEAEDDDLPPGPWNRPPAADNRPGQDESGDGDHISEIAVEDEMATRHSTAAIHSATGASLPPCKENSTGFPSPSLPLAPSSTIEPEDTQSELLLRELAAAHPEQPKFDVEQRPLGQPRPRRRQSHQQSGGPRRKQPLKSSSRKQAPSTNATSKKGGNHPTTPEILQLTARRRQRLICRVPHCSAVLTSLSTLHTHERSHATAPEYHRLRRAPQIFRDPPPASSEGDGADAAQFSLRTTLPASVRQELQQLQEESAYRRRGSLLSLPGLAGAAATWAGVVGPGRKVGESV